jgi:hypothetical protein
MVNAERSPNIVPANHKALLLSESLHEILRNLADTFDAEFHTLLAQAEQQAGRLEAALKETLLGRE